MFKKLLTFCVAMSMSLCFACVTRPETAKATTSAASVAKEDKKAAKADSAKATASSAKQ